MSENKSYGIVALILGILSVVLSSTMILSFILGIISIVLGILALKTIRKNMGIASIILGALGIIFSIIISILLLFIIYGVELLDVDKQKKVETLTLGDISILYNDSWKIDELNTNEQAKVIKKGNIKIAMVLTSGKIFYSQEQFINKVKKEYESMYDDVKVGKGELINGNTWIDIEYSYNKKDRKYHTILFY